MSSPNKVVSQENGPPDEMLSRFPSAVARPTEQLIAAYAQAHSWSLKVVLTHYGKGQKRVRIERDELAVPVRSGWRENAKAYYAATNLPPDRCDIVWDADGVRFATT